MLRKILRLEHSDLSVLLIPASVFALVQLITGGVMLIGRPDTCVLISPVLLLVICVLLALIMVTGYGMLSFEQAVRMGATRRMALRLMLGLSVVHTTILFACGGVLVLLEQLLGRFVWPALSPGVQMMNFLDMIPWWGYLLAYGGSLLLGFIAGAGIQRFGAKFAWGIWGIWMAWFFVFDKLPLRGHQIINWLIPCALILLAGMLVWSVWSYRHAVIRR